MGLQKEMCGARRPAEGSSIEVRGSLMNAGPRT